METTKRWNPTISASVAENPSASAPIIFRGPLNEAVRRAADIGYTGIDFHISGKSDTSIKNIGRILKPAGIRLAAVATGNIYAKDGLSLSSESKEVVSAAEAVIKSVMQDSCELGAVVIIGIARGRLGQEGDPLRSDSYKRLVDSVRELAQIARGIGSTLAIEAISRLDADSINDTEALLHFLDQVDSPSVKANLDTFHMLIECENIETAIIHTAGQLACFHIADADRKCPSLTEMNLMPILRALKRTRYDGAITMEYTPCEEGCSRTMMICEAAQDKFARKGLEYLRGCILSI